LRLGSQAIKNPPRITQHGPNIDTWLVGAGGGGTGGALQSPARVPKYFYFCPVRSTADSVDGCTPRPNDPLWYLSFFFHRLRNPVILGSDFENTVVSRHTTSTFTGAFLSPKTAHTSELGGCTHPAHKILNVEWPALVRVVNPSHRNFCDCAEDRVV
jgi:hypothetical protein